MAEEAIEIDVRFEGVEEAAASSTRMAAAIEALAAKVAALGAPLDRTEEKTKKVKTAEELAADAAKKLAQEQQLLATKSIQFTQRLGSLAMAVQTLTTQLGGQSRTAGLIGASIQTSTQFAQLGGMLGPQGAFVGGIIGAAVPAIQQLAEMQDTAALAAREHAEALDEARAALARLADASIQSDIAAGVFGADMTPQRAREEREVRRARIVEIERELQEQGDTAHRIARFTMGISEEAHRDRMRQLSNEAEAARQQMETLDRLIDRQGRVSMGTDAAGIVTPGAQAAGSTASRAPRGGGGGGESYADRVAAAEERRAAALAEIAERIEEQKRAEDGLREQAFANHEAAMAEHQDKLNAIHEQAAAEQAAIDERIAREEEAQDKLNDLREEQKARAQAQVEEYQSVTGVIVGGLTDALSAIISGQKSAEEAFKGLLAAFLNFISEQSALKAASEFAFAIADFASQNYSGGVQHLAAGVAFTAVAVAAGAGGAALSAPAAAAPQEGASSRDRDTGGGGNVTYVVQYNAPVLTDADRAAGGRALRPFLTAADDRFGAAA